MNNKTDKLKKEKSRKLFSAIRVENSSYLKMNIVPVKANTARFRCVLCSKRFGKDTTGFVEYLPQHLTSENHMNTVVSEQDGEQLQKALNYLKTKEDSKETIDVLNATENQNRDDFVRNEVSSRGQLNERFIQNPASRGNEAANFRNSQPYFRMQIADFVLQNNLAFDVVEDLMKLIKELITRHDLASLRSFTMNRNLMSNIAGTYARSYIQSKLLKRLTKTPFSISVDEGSVKSRIEYLSIYARFFNSDEDTQTVTRLIGLIQMGENSTGEELYSKIHKFLFSGPDGEQRLQCCLGISSDGASNMISKLDKGAATRLKAENPHMVVVHDFCHALNLVLKDSLKTFPNSYLAIINDITSFFSRSPQRTARLRRIAGRSFNSKNLMILRHVKTRWSSLQESLQRVLEMVNPLRVYFQEESESDDQKEYLSNQNVVVFRLLLTLVNALNFYIKYFQKEDLDIIDIVRTLKNCLVIFGRYLFKVGDTQGPNAGEEFQDPDSIFIQIAKLAQEDENNQSRMAMTRTKDEFQTYLLSKHPELRRDLEGQEPEFAQNYIDMAMKFFNKAFRGIASRLPQFDSSIILADSFLLKKVTSLDGLRKLATYFNNIISNEDTIHINEEISRLELSASDMRDRIRSSKCFLDVWKQERSNYPMLYKLARAIQVLPYSTASVERGFSNIGDLKTLKRNRLSVKTLEGSLLTRQEFKNGSILSSPELLVNYISSPPSSDDPLEENDDVELKHVPANSNSEDQGVEEILMLKPDQTDQGGGQSLKDQSHNDQVIPEMGFMWNPNFRNMLMEMTGALFQSAIQTMPNNMLNETPEVSAKKRKLTEPASNVFLKQSRNSALDTSNNDLPVITVDLRMGSKGHEPIFEELVEDQGIRIDVEDEDEDQKERQDKGEEETVIEKMILEEDESVQEGNDESYEERGKTKTKGRGRRRK